MNKNKHLLSDERIRIEELLKEGRSFKAIANELGKSPTTVSREIRSHTITKNVGSPAVPIITVSTDFRVLPAFSAKNAVSDAFALTVTSVNFVILYVPGMSLIPAACWENLPMFVMAVQNVTSPVLYRSISIILFLRKSSTKKNCLKPDQVFP